MMGADAHLADAEGYVTLVAELKQCIADARLGAALRSIASLCSSTGDSVGTFFLVR
jgi:hypothetical protein